MKNHLEQGIVIPDIQPVWPSTKSEPVMEARGVLPSSERNQLDGNTLAAMKEVSDAMLNGIATDSNGDAINPSLAEYVIGNVELPTANVVVDLARIEPQG